MTSPAEQWCRDCEHLHPLSAKRRVAAWLCMKDPQDPVQGKQSPTEPLREPWGYCWKKFKPTDETCDDFEPKREGESNAEL